MTDDQLRDELAFLAVIAAEWVDDPNVRDAADDTLAELQASPDADPVRFLPRVEALQDALRRAMYPGSHRDT